MKVSTQQSTAKIKRWVRVDNGPVHAQAYSSSGKRFRVELVTIEYAWKNGEWVIDSSFAVSLTGTVLKKDGTDSKVTHSGHPEYKSWNSREYGDEFEWLNEVIEILRPRADLSMVTLREHEL